MDRIYLDYAATTPLSPVACEAMKPWLEERYGNPSSLYAEGREAKAAIDQARETVSKALGCLFGEVTFTSGGTEAANLAVIGAALGNTDASRRRILFGAAEHHCVLHTRPILERLGYTVQMVAVDDIARVRLDDLEYRLGSDVLLVSVMHANNEFGTIQPAREVAALCRAKRALYHCDAVQTFVGVNWTTDKIGADLVTVSAHKIGGPKGVGALYVKSGTKVKSVAVGGGQEREMRAGTENVAGIVGFAAAVKEGLALGVPARADHRRKCRDAFLGALTNGRFKETVPDRLDALPGHAHIRCPGIEAETMLIRLDRMGVSASSGAACSSGSLEASHVMIGAGYPISQAKEGLRFTFGDQSSIEQAQRAARIVNEAASEIDAQR